MSKALVLGVAALAISAGAASAQVPGYNYNGATVPLYGYPAPGYGYGATTPLYNYAAPAYGYAAPAPLYDYAPQPYGYASPGYGSDYSPPGSWARGYWSRRSYGWQ